jgi:hypothetical protein
MTDFPREDGIEDRNRQIQDRLNALESAVRRLTGQVERLERLRAAAAQGVDNL